MAIITQITTQKDKTRVNVFLDGVFAVGVTSFALAKTGIKEGQEISSERLQTLLMESECDSALARAYKYISLKPVTIQKMREYLAGKGFEEYATEFAVSRLIDLRLLDDSEYAKLYVNSCRDRQGNSLMRYKLRGMGVSDADMQDALTDEGDAAIKAAKKYLKTHKNDRQKLYSYLSNKGFGSDSCKAALRLCEVDGEDSDGEFLD